MKEHRIMFYLIVALVVLMFLISLLAVTMNSAALIRDRLLEEIETQYEANAQVYRQRFSELSAAMTEDQAARQSKDNAERQQAEPAAQYAAYAGDIPEPAAEEASPSETDWAWYNTLRELAVSEDYSSDIATVGYLALMERDELQDTDPNTEYYSYSTYILGGRNMLLITLYNDDGTETHIPAVFEADNTADVIQLFQHVESGVHYKSQFLIEGYWENGLYYLVRLTQRSGGSATYSHPFYDVVNGYNSEKQWTTYTVEETDYRPHSWNILILEKTHSTSYGADYAAQWDDVDKLADRLRTKFWAQVGDTYELLSDTLFSVQVCAAVEKHLGRGAAYDDALLYYIYGASFSPFSLAWQSMIRNGTLLLLIAGFAGTMILLLFGYSRLRQMEIRALQDEITRQGQALNYARDAEQSRREMTSAIAHELKTPIAVLSSYAEALEENIDADKQAHYMAVIREETGKMDRMVLELLDLSRLEAGKYRIRREDFDLERLARDVIEPLTPSLEAKEITLEWQVGSPTVNADPYRIGQIVENFMTNAIRHTPRGGKIILRIGTERETLSVENQGKPIPAENLKKVWETFWQGDASRNERGSGLGLAICRTIVSLHGGSCKAENTASGVCFSISLDKEKRLYQLGKMPQEEIIELDFPIAQWYTTVESVMTRLNFAKGKLLLQELREGNLRVGQEVVTDRREKLYPGYVLSWREYRIAIRLDDDEKRRMLLMERMRPGGLGNPNIINARGYVPMR